MEADLDDSFMFSSSFMLVCWEDVGSSWGLKVKLDDSFTFLSCFTGLLGPAVAPGNSGCRFFDPKWTPKVVHKLLEFWLTYFSLFWDRLFDHFGGQIGPKIGPRGAKMNPTRTSRASKYRTKHSQQVWFPDAKTILFESWRLPRRS